MLRTDAICNRTALLSPGSAAGLQVTCGGLQSAHTAAVAALAAEHGIRAHLLVGCCATTSSWDVPDVSLDKAVHIGICRFEASGRLCLLGTT